MSDLDDSLRLMIEEMIDEFIAHPKEYVHAFNNALVDLGIVPDLESILAYVTGMITGSIMAFQHIESNDAAPIPSFAHFEYFPLIMRRANELRQAFSQESQGKGWW